eukprot:471176_1
MEQVSIAIELSSINQLQETKEEEEFKSIHDDPLYQSPNVNDFIEPRADDYIDCHKQLQQCSAANRIVYLLKYYKIARKCATNSDNQTVPIYDNISTLHPKYHINNVMDDWHHIKTNHLSDINNTQYFEHNTLINCTDGENCFQFNRYQRNRTKDTYIDHRNVILVDRLDSIHAYLFHASLFRFRNGLENDHECNLSLLSENEIDIQQEILNMPQKANSTYIDGEYERVDEKEKLIESKIMNQAKSAAIMLDQPESISQYTVDQIVFVLNHEETTNHFEKLKPYQPQIVQYIKMNDVNGESLLNMKRKDFMKNIAAYCNNKKITIALGKLYKYIISDERLILFGQVNKDEEQNPDLWSNKPMSISDCNVSQIISILKNNIIQKLDKLTEHQLKIYEYLKEMQFDGTKFINTHKKEFISQLIQKLGDKTLTMQTAQLYKQVITYDVSTCWSNSTQYISSKSDNKQNVWSDNPQSISECNLHQIAFIAECCILNKLDKLQPLKSDITDFMIQNKFDGSKLNAISRKQFISEFAERLEDKKLKAQLGKLYTTMIKFYDISPLVKIVNDHDESAASKPTNDISHQTNSKFVSSSSNISDSYYAFGEQYRYTDSNSHHPLYIKPKYESIKNELVQYFTATNLENDKYQLLSKQMSKIASMNPKTAQLALRLVDTKTHETNMHIVVSWFLNDLSNKKDFSYKIIKTVYLYSLVDVLLEVKEIFLSDFVSNSNDDLLRTMQFERENGEKLRHMMQNIFPSALQIENEYTITLNTLLNLSFQQTVQYIRTKLKHYLFELKELLLRLIQKERKIQKKIRSVLIKVFDGNLRPYLNLEQMTEEINDVTIEQISIDMRQMTRDTSKIIQINQDDLWKAFQKHKYGKIQYKDDLYAIVNKDDKNVKLSEIVSDLGFREYNDRKKIYNLLFDSLKKMIHTIDTKAVIDIFYKISGFNKKRFHYETAAMCEY